MAHYLVTARPRAEKMEELRSRLASGDFLELRPFGTALTTSLLRARVRPDGLAAWEEEDYCTPPLAQERAAVLDDCFEELSVERVPEGEGWDRIRELPPLFPGLE